MTSLLSLMLAALMSFSFVNFDDGFSDWDKDGDGFIERYEFVDIFVDKYFDTWDDEGMKAGIVEEDFFQQSYAGLDTDNDHWLSDEEWLVGYNYFYDDYIVYDENFIIDVNEDGKIEYQEYYDALYETDFFTDIDLDSDNYISEYELADYVFDNWDTNDSGLISRSEFNQFDWYYLDV